MKFLNWFKPNSMPRSKAAVSELFETVGIHDTPEWQAIESHFTNNEIPPSELIYAAFRHFISSKDLYIHGLTQDAYALREQLVITTMSMVGGVHE